MKIEINVRVCQNCKAHSWCTRHEQGLYDRHFLSLKECLQSRLADVYVIRSYQQKGGERIMPVIGSFQIEIFQVLIFSKLQSKLWPNHSRILSLVESIIQDQTNGLSLHKYQIRRKIQAPLLTPRQLSDRGGVPNQSNSSYSKQSRPLTAAKFSRKKVERDLELRQIKVTLPKRLDARVYLKVQSLNETTTDVVQIDQKTARFNSKLNLITTQGKPIEFNLFNEQSDYLASATIDNKFLSSKSGHYEGNIQLKSGKLGGLYFKYKEAGLQDQQQDYDYSEQSFQDSDDLKLQISDLKKRLEQANHKKQLKSKQLQDQQRKTGELNLKHQKDLQRIQELVHQKKVLNEKLQELRNQSSERQSQMTRAQQSLQGQVERLKNELQRKKAEVQKKADQHMKQKRQDEQRSKALFDQKTKEETQRKKLEEDNRKLEGDLVKLKEQSKLKQEQLQKAVRLGKELQAIKLQLQKNNAEKQRLVSELSSEKEVIQRMKSQMKSKKSQQESLMKSLQDRHKVQFQTLKSTLTAQLIKQQGRRVELEQQLQRLKKQQAQFQLKMKQAKQKQKQAQRFKKQQKSNVLDSFIYNKSKFALPIKLNLSNLKAILNQGQELGGKIDPFLEISLNGKSFLTQVHQEAGKRPVWKKSFELNYVNSQSAIFSVYDKDMTSRDFIGKAQVPFLFFKEDSQSTQIEIFDKGLVTGRVLFDYRVCFNQPFDGKPLSVAIANITLNGVQSKSTFQFRSKALKTKFIPGVVLTQLAQEQLKIISLNSSNKEIGRTIIRFGLIAKGKGSRAFNLYNQQAQPIGQIMIFFDDGLPLQKKQLGQPTSTEPQKEKVKIAQPKVQLDDQQQLQLLNQYQQEFQAQSKSIQIHSFQCQLQKQCQQLRVELFRSSKTQASEQRSGKLIMWQKQFWFPRSESQKIEIRICDKSSTLTSKEYVVQQLVKSNSAYRLDLIFKKEHLGSFSFLVSQVDTSTLDFLLRQKRLFNLKLSSFAATFKYFTELTGKIDPYLKISCNNFTQQTQEIPQGGQKVAWKKQMSFRVQKGNVISIIAFDKDSLSSDLLGSAFIRQRQMSWGKGRVQLPLKKNNETTGKVQFSYEMG